MVLRGNNGPDESHLGSCDTNNSHDCNTKSVSYVTQTMESAITIVTK